MAEPNGDLALVDEVSVPAVSRDQMRDVDRLMVDEYGVALLQMMENAGRNVAELACHLLGGLAGRRICFVAGKGNNGGGALAGARHASNRGATVEVVLAYEHGDLAAAPRHQLRTLHASDVPVRTLGGPLPEADLYVDGIVGYGLSGAIRGRVQQATQALAAVAAPVLGIDIPTGLDADTGMAMGEAVHCSATMTLALPKVGLMSDEARPFVGDLYLADIAVPPQLYARLGLTVPSLFAAGSLLSIRRD